MRRFFYPTPHSLSIGKTLALMEDNYQHWCKVLRAKVGDQAVFFDGTGGEYLAQLIEITKKSALITVLDYNPINRTNPYHTTLLQALSANDKMDYTVQKACEMGVNCIQLIITERSEQLKYEREQKKLSHWQKIAISSCEQCGLNLIPDIRPPIPLSQALAEDKSNLKLLLDFENTATTLPNSTPSLSLLVGAEGGLSSQEIKNARTAGFLGLNLGERILRTETAGVVAMARLAQHFISYS